MQEVAIVREVLLKIKQHAFKWTTAQHLPAIPADNPFHHFLREDDLREVIPARWASVLDQQLGKTSYKDAIAQLQQVARHYNYRGRVISSQSTKETLLKLGIVERNIPGRKEENFADLGAEVVEAKTLDVVHDQEEAEDIAESGAPDELSHSDSRQSSMPPGGVDSPATGDDENGRAANDEDINLTVLDRRSFESLTAEDAALEPFDMGKLDVPQLTFDLSRVLFNPGVYQLQDPRSRVYNFDPYLQKIMPVSEFNFDALNEYVTSSRDGYLRDLAQQKDKRYVGSSSSLSAALSHFHFLLSSWREINVDSLSRGFKVEGLNFTRIHRAPSAIFLRYKDGVYAVDADKEFDSANILMSLGKSMEKLVTVEKEEFEQYRKSTTELQQDLNSQPEQYHYAGLGKFLLRSQLDAYDPRLPGTGMFDLKTRAVVAVRHILSEYEKGQGYQIKARQGTWESYEREYYDMIRSAFLKYSLQVRMGRMDGIFVTYHNVETIFGFQYIALPELDLALHGQNDRTLGDQEFGFSIKLLSEIFDRVTTQYPEQTIRFHFDTRQSEAKVRQQVHRMYVFAEPMSEEEAQEIQERNIEEIAALEEDFRTGALPDREESTKSNADQSDAAPDPLPARQDNAADVDFLDTLGDLDLTAEADSTASTSSAPHSAETRPKNSVLGFELVVRSRVNDKPVLRPHQITAADKWTLDYNLAPMPEQQAEAKYAMCKYRRKNALKESSTSEIAMNTYLQELVRMSEQGAQWRREQEAQDAQRERVVLYQDRNGNETRDA
jgi:Mitochondrial protein Pet127